MLSDASQCASLNLNQDGVCVFLYSLPRKLRETISVFTDSVGTQGAGWLVTFGVSDLCQSEYALGSETGLNLQGEQFGGHIRNVIERNSLPSDNPEAPKLQFLFTNSARFLSLVCYVRMEFSLA